MEPKQKIHSFADLEAWKKAHALVVNIYVRTRKYPKDEQFGITNQMRRAAVSITSNIAEGFSRISPKEKAQFYAIAQGSVTELQNQLLISRDVGYLTHDEHEKLELQTVTVHKLVNGLMKYVRTLFALLLFPLILYTSYFILPAPSARASFTTGASSATTLTKGLVGYWTFDGKDTNWNTNKTNDLSGQGNTGTMTSMSTTTSPVAGKIGQALNFNAAVGVTQNVDAGATASLNDIETQGGGGMTVSAWIYPKSVGSNDSMIIGKSNVCTPTNGAWDVTLDGSNVGRLYFEKSYGTTCLMRETVTSAITLKKWQYVTVTWDGSATAANVHIYVNGVESSYQTTQNGVGSKVSDAANHMDISYFAGSRNFNGYIDDVRVYKRVLSLAEITQLYKLGAAKLAVSPVNSIKTGLVGYWTMDGKDTNWATGKTNDVSGII